MRPYVLATITGTLYFISFAGFGIWPLAYVALVPILWALDPAVQRVPLRRRTVILSGALFGLVLNVGGYYWVATTLRSFSGFSYVWCVALASILWAYQGLEMALFAWLFHRMRTAGTGNLLAAVVAMSLAEWIFPTLFKHYFGASLHNTPLAIQVADLGGPLLVTALVTAANVALYELSLAHRNRHIARRPVVVAAALWAATLGYGAYRMHEVDARVASAPKIEVGMVQTNMGLTQKRDDPEEGLKRHIAQSVELQKDKKLDLLVWPESAFGWFLPADLKNVREAVFNDQIHVPTLFGGLARREHEGKLRLYNTAFMTDADGGIVGTYDKTFLLAFGEYIPFGDKFPALYDISPNSGRFTPGDHVQPVPLGPYRVGVLVCYEDILPGFVREAVRVGTPHVLVNVTNDAWFGDTHAPWEHLALAKLRAVEHHRALVRSTNSGVSAVIDPVGRTVAQTKVFTRENLSAQVPMLADDTVYLKVGDFPGYLSLVAFLAALWLGRKRAQASS